MNVGRDREHYGNCSGSISSNLYPSVGFDNTHRWVYDDMNVTWGELIRKLKAVGYVEQRSGKGSHRQFIHPTTGHVITVAVHTKKEVGTGLASRILKEAGLK